MRKLYTSGELPTSIDAEAVGYVSAGLLTQDKVKVSEVSGVVLRCML